MSQSTKKLESIKKKSVRIMGNTFDEKLQIEWAINAVENELSRRLQEEVLKTKEEIVSIFKWVFRMSEITTKECSTTLVFDFLKAW